MCTAWNPVFFYWSFYAPWNYYSALKQKRAVRRERDGPLLLIFDRLKPKVTEP